MPAHLIPSVLDAGSVRTCRRTPTGTLELVLQGADDLGAETDVPLLITPSLLTLLNHVARHGAPPDSKPPGKPRRRRPKLAAFVQARRAARRPD